MHQFAGFVRKYAFNKCIKNIKIKAAPILKQLCNLNLCKYLLFNPPLAVFPVGTLYPVV